MTPLDGCPTIRDVAAKRAPRRKATVLVTGRHLATPDRPPTAAEAERAMAFLETLRTGVRVWSLDLRRGGMPDGATTALLASALKATRAAERAWSKIGGATIGRLADDVERALDWVFAEPPTPETLATGGLGVARVRPAGAAGARWDRTIDRSAAEVRATLMRIDPSFDALTVGVVATTLREWPTARGRGRPSASRPRTRKEVVGALLALAKLSTASGPSLSKMRQRARRS